MYEKISEEMNSRFGSSDMDAGLVENYLRFRDDSYLSAHETVQIDVLYDRFV